MSETSVSAYASFCSTLSRHAGTPIAKSDRRRRCDISGNRSFSTASERMTSSSSNDDEIEVINEFEAKPSYGKWVALSFCLAIIVAAGIYAGIHSDQVSDWGQHHTTEFLSIVGASSLLMAMGLFHVFKKVKKENDEAKTRWYQDLSLVVSIGLIATLCIFHPAVHDFLHIKTELLDFSSPCALPVVFGMGALAGISGYYGYFYRHHKIKDIDFAGIPGAWEGRDSDVQDGDE